MQESPGSDREIIETHSPLSLSQISNSMKKSHTQHIKANAWQKANIHEDNINTEKQHKPMKLNQRLSSINSICTWLFFTSSLLCSSLAPVFNMLDFFLQCTKEGAYILFSLSNSTTIKSTINSYLTTLILINAFLSIIQYKCASLWMASWKSDARISKVFSKFYAGAIQLSFLPHALARLMSCRCSCITIW